jgi:hypothetical protein
MNVIKHVNSLKHLALATMLVVSLNSAHATLITYSLLGVSTSAGSLTGTVSIDSITDLVTAANITFNDTAAGSPVFTNIGSPAAYNGLGQDFISGPSNSPLNYGGQIALYYDTANIGIGSLNLCLAAGPCGTSSNRATYAQVYISNSNGGPFYVTGGSLDPSAAITPEPASLFLLGTGIIGIAVLGRNSFFRPKA